MYLCNGSEYEAVNTYIDLDKKIILPIVFIYAPRVCIFIHRFPIE